MIAPPAAPGVRSAPIPVVPSTPPAPGVPDDPVQRRAFIRASKTIEGWQCVDTEHYLFLVPNDVDPSFVRMSTRVAEAFRTEVLQPRFPVDDFRSGPLVVRVFPNQASYAEHGGPPGTTGHVGTHCEEVVLFEDALSRKNSIRALQALLCASRLWAELGLRNGHAWFRVGFVEWAAAHTMHQGHLVVDRSVPTLTTAEAIRRGANPPRLADLLSWEGNAGARGSSLEALSMWQIRALAADFVTFLVGSDSEISQIPATYYAALRRGATETDALDEAFRGLDLTDIERAWRAR